MHPCGATTPPVRLVAYAAPCTVRCIGVWRSLVAHSLWERGAVGSNPATPTMTGSPEPWLGKGLGT